MNLKKLVARLRPDPVELERALEEHVDTLLVLVASLALSTLTRRLWERFEQLEVLNARVVEMSAQLAGPGEPAAAEEGPDIPAPADTEEVPA